MLVQSAPPIGVQFLACTGAIVSGEIAGVTADTRDKTSDAQLAELRPGEVFDVISLTFGGNNLGFRDIITGCLTNLGGDYLNSYLLDGELGLLVINNRPGFCTIDERAMQRKIGELESLLRDLYERLATEHLKPGGRLYVLGYPHLFAPPEDWPGDAKWFTCSGVKQTDAKQIRELTVQLNHATAAAADTANDTAEPRGVRVIWLPVDKLFANHELCGPEPRWINSWPTVDLEFRGTDLLAYMSGSFHPNEKGHAAEAALLVAQVRSDLMIDSQ
jgi:hypothetical protein